MDSAISAGFGFASVASGYSQITGLLAGFSFAAIGVLLVKPSDEKFGPAAAADQEISSAAILALLVSFGILMLASFAYAGVPGPQPPLNALLFFIGGSLFAMGVTTIFTAIAWLFVIYKLSKSVLAFSRVLSCGAILVAVFNELYPAYLLVGLMGDQMPFAAENFEVIAIAIVLLLIVILFLVSFLSSRRGDAVTSARLFRIMMLIVLLGAILAGAYIALVAAWPSKSPITSLAPGLVVQGTLLFTIVNSILCVWAQPPHSLWSDLWVAVAIGRRKQR